MGEEVLIPAVMCGGSGSRLWPLSRAQLPKPFVELPSGGSLLQETFAGLAGSGAKHVVAICEAEHVASVRTAYQRSGLDVALALIAEPCARNTGPAAAVAARFVAARHGRDAVVALLPADHAIADRKGFVQAVRVAAAAARTGRLAVLGIYPAHPSTGYGYIRAGKPAEGGWSELEAFIEKPDLQRAQQMIESGSHYWNAGVFAACAGMLAEQFAKHAPEIAGVAGQLEVPAGNADWHPDAEAYAKFPSISIDYAIAEKTAEAAVVPDVDVGWSDVGSWSSYAKLLPAQADGNRSTGEAKFAESRNCATYSTTGRLVAVAGLEDTVVVDTADALLVAKAGSDGAVRRIYDQLARAADLRALSPTVEKRPWGSYSVLASGPGFKIKRITVDAGQRLSLQSHKHRSEHWTTSSGVMTVTIGVRTFDQARDSSCHIPQGAKHRMANRTSEPAEIIELQLGDYLGEDDIERYEDDYERA